MTPDDLPPPRPARPRLSWPRKPARGRIRAEARRCLLRALVRERARGVTGARIQMDGLLQGIRYRDGSLLMVFGCPKLRMAPPGALRRHEAWRARKERVRPSDVLHVERYPRDALPGEPGKRALIRIRPRKAR